MKIRNIYLAITTLVLSTLLVLPGSAFAHVTVDPPQGKKGSYGTFTIRVPNEDDIESTNKIEIEIPQDEVISHVGVMPVQGWTYSFTKVASDKKIDGKPVGEVVSKVTFEGGKIGPGEFQEFKITLGRLPEKADSLTLKSVQTYTDGRQSKWIEEPIDGKEAENPAPLIALDDGQEVPVGSDQITPLKVQKKDVNENNNVLAFSALGISLLALALGAIALFKKRS